MNIVPSSAQLILEKTLDNLRIRANSKGECFGGEIMDAMRDAGRFLGADRFEILLTRTVLVRIMESLGENCPSEILHNCEQRIPFSRATKFLREAIERTARLKWSCKCAGECATAAKNLAEFGRHKS